MRRHSYTLALITTLAACAEPTELDRPALEAFAGVGHVKVETLDDGRLLVEDDMVMSASQLDDYMDDLSAAAHEDVFGEGHGEEGWHDDLLAQDEASLTLSRRNGTVCRTSASARRRRPA